MRRGYDRVEGSIGMSYDEIKGVTMSLSRDFHMLGKITTGKKVEKDLIVYIIYVYIYTCMYVYIYIYIYI